MSEHPQSLLSWVVLVIFCVNFGFGQFGMGLITNYVMFERGGRHYKPYIVFGKVVKNITSGEGQKPLNQNNVICEQPFTGFITSLGILGFLIFMIQPRKLHCPCLAISIPNYFNLINIILTPPGKHTNQLSRIHNPPRWKQQMVQRHKSTNHERY